MRLTVIVPIVLALATSTPAIGQTTPLDRLLGKIPSIFGSSPGQPKVTIPSTPVLPGLTTVADRAAAGDAAGFDLGGFRLGMSEAAVQANVKARGLRSERATRFVDFESQVRSFIAVRGGQGGATEGSVLGEVDLRDDAGGTYMLKMLVWPDGSHLESITYLAPQGTAIAEWRRMLTAKWGRPVVEETVRDQWQARWGTRASGGVTARAELGPRGGSVSIASPDGAHQQPGALIEQAADAFMAARARKPTL